MPLFPQLAGAPQAGIMRTNSRYPSPVTFTIPAVFRSGLSLSYGNQKCWADFGPDPGGGTIFLHVISASRARLKWAVVWQVTQWLGCRLLTLRHLPGTSTTIECCIGI